ncbi:hypothetical protein D3C77_518690 [compost metagenome]
MLESRRRKNRQWRSVQSIIGATLKRRDGSGRVFTEVAAVSKGISSNVFCIDVRGGRFYQVLGAMYQSKIDVYQFHLATIRARKKVDGTTSYTVQIRINRDDKLVYQENRTFARKQAAQAWSKRRETELSEPGAIERANRKGHSVPLGMEAISPSRTTSAWLSLCGAARAR